MKKVILIVTLALAVVLVSTCAKRKEGYCRLKYQAVDTSESTIYYACQDQSKLSEKPAQLKDLPKKISGQFSYFLANIGGRDIPLIIDGSDKYRLYMDVDGDGFLSDERSFSATPVKRRFFGSVNHYRFGPISIKFNQADGKFAKQIYIITRGKRIEYLCICPADYRKGKLLLGQNIYEVAVVDGNFDGKYSKIFSPPVTNFFRPGCDSFAIDLNRNGKLDYNFYFHSELMPLSKMIKVGNSYYNINVAEGGESLELSKIQPDCGTLDFGNVNVKLKLWSNAAQQYFSNIGSNVEIPTGLYQALFVELSQIDSERNTWDFTSYTNTGALRNFEIGKNETISFKIGPPFRITTTARQNGNTVNINFELLGQTGEQYRPDFKRNAIRVSPPVLRIIDEADGLIDSGRFKYG